MKARGQRRGKGGKQTNKEKFKKLKDSVSDFVKSKGGFDKNENDQRVKFVKRKSRKDLRKEKRKLKKVKMKNHYMGQSMAKSSEELNQNTPVVKEENTHKPALKKTADAEHAPRTQQKAIKGNPKIKEGEEETKHKKVHFSEDLPKQNESRKLALLEANVEEDREIKKLEKRLGLNKRKNKKSLPQSFTDDGLDYILGILESGASATGLYDSDEEMDIDKAKENFDELDEDSDDEQMTDEEEKDDGEEEDEAQMEEEEDVEEEDTQIDDEEVEGDEEEENDETDASEGNEEAEEAESEQKTPESKELVCH